jgi:DNA-binding transcriptional ArsR family regulator
MDAIVDVLKALADSTRFRILVAVSERECAVSELAERVGAHVAAVSQHLAKLRTAGLVVQRRDGTRIFYRAATPQIATVLEEVGLLTGYVTGVIDEPRHGPDGPAPAADAPQAAVVWSPRLRYA